MLTFACTVPLGGNIYTSTALSSAREADSDNETDSDVFQSTSTSSALLPIPLESHKQRRATVSGGSPPSGKRNSIEIAELSSSSRPKSYTISSPSSDGSHIDFSSDLLSPQSLDDRQGDYRRLGQDGKWQVVLIN